MALIDVLRKQHGEEFHPALLLSKVVADEDEDIKLRVDCAKSLMPYIESARKAVEVKGELKNDYGVLRVSLFEEAMTEDADE